MIYKNSKQIKGIYYFGAEIKKIIYNSLCVYNSGVQELPTSVNLLNPYKVERGRGMAGVTATDELITLTSLSVGAEANSEIIKCNNTTYSYSFSGDIDSITIKAMCYDTNDFFLGQCNVLFENDGQCVVTTLNNTDYIRLVFVASKAGYIKLNNFIFAEGGTIIPFVPFVQ